MSNNPTLTPREFEAWMLFSGVMELMPTALNAQLLRDSGLSLMEFYVLLFLRDSGDDGLRVSALAACTSATVPRMSKVVSRLEGEGFVARAGAAGDGRAVNVQLTDAGADKLQSALPEHEGQIRELALDALSSDQIDALAEISRAMLSRLHPDATLPIDRQGSSAEAS